ncbi:MAG: methyltransferase domain-containing protein [Thermoplasmata archaeon]
MSPPEERYVIRGGKEGYDRLLVLARDRWPDTLALFQRAGLAPGMRCLDLGCGGGEVTLQMAKLVAPGGRARGVDMDAVKLGLARQAAIERQVDNVEFTQTNVDDWNESNAYDAVYSRLLLQHVREPVELLRRMWAAVRPGGLLMVEDADFEGCCCEPANEAFDFYVRSYSEVLRRNAGDPVLGRKLYRHFLAAGIPHPKVTAVQPVRIEQEAKSLPWLSLQATQEAILSAGLAKRGEFDAALESLAKFCADPATLVSGPRMFQVWSRR